MNEKSDLPAGSLHTIYCTQACPINQAVVEYLLMSKTAKRLYEGFQPEHYDVSFTFDTAAMTFSGTVVIKGKKVGRPSKRITLHQRALDVTKAHITKHDKKGDTAITPSRLNQHHKLEEVRIHADSLLYPGNYTIAVDFQGAITDAMVGIYPCYFEHKGQKKFLIATQFESHHARAAFPCIDEPEAKATFTLTLQTPKDDVVLSNTNPESEKVSDAIKTTTFARSPRMSTYLLAFVFGDMHSVEAKTKDGTLVRSWASVAQPKKLLQYSVDEAVKVLGFFSEYFQTPYPLEKCDQVALPDFDAGAMENWGLITYREVALLADPDNRSITSEQYVSLVVAHELSHQWFGNLVTMKWWDDLWLNESFASIMEHVALNNLHPDWQQWETYASSDVLAATSRDIYKDIQPVGVEVTDPEIIETLFDPGIVYAKGGRLIKMLREYIGDDAFRKGLKTYFEAFAYKNATRDDLWRHLGKASGKDIHGLMTPWLTQPGMPLLSVARSGDMVTLTQERYVLDGGNDDTRWPIPLLAGRSVEPEIITEASTTLQQKNFVRFNQNASGHYLVRYQDKAAQTKLQEAFSTQTMPAEARIDLVNTLYMLARRGDTPLTDALRLISQAENEPRDSVWSLILRTLGAATQLTEGDKTAETALKHLKVGLATKQYQKLGWDDDAADDPNTKQLRHTMIALMVGGENQQAIQEALTRYQPDTLEDISAELRSTILGAAVRFGDAEAIDTLLAAYPKASAELQLDITSAVLSTRQPAQGQKILATALGKSGFVRPQDVMRWLAISLRNHHIRDVAWQFMEDNWAWVEQTIGQGKSFDYVPTYAAAVISTPDWQKKYTLFFEPKLEQKILRHNIILGLADIKARVAWRGRDEAAIKTWLKSL